MEVKLISKFFFQKKLRSKRKELLHDLRLDTKRLTKRTGSLIFSFHVYIFKLLFIGNTAKFKLLCSKSFKRRRLTDEGYILTFDANTSLLIIIVGVLSCQ